MINADVKCGPRREVFLADRNKDQVTKIGRQLNDAGGFGLMRWVANHLLQKALQSGNIEFRMDIRGLDMNWNGIGEWHS